MKIKVKINREPGSDEWRDAVRTSSMDLALLGARSIRINKGEQAISAEIEKDAVGDEELLDVLQRVFHPWVVVEVGGE